MSQLKTLPELALHIVGLSVEAGCPLSDAAMQAIKTSQVVLGSERQWSLIKPYLSEADFSNEKPVFVELPAFSQWLSVIEQQYQQGRTAMAILASGDPLYFGAGSWFARTFENKHLRFYPAVSSIQAACHRLGLSQQYVDVVSLHGRPLNSLRRVLKQNQSLAILTDQYSCPTALASIAVEMGFDQAQLHVCERLGYTDEQVRSFCVSDPLLQSLTFDPLQVSILQTQSSTRFVAEFPGIPDDVFITDGEKGRGLLTKREVRLAILSWLQPSRGDVIWDIGAGCGSVSIELALWQTQHQVWAVEQHAERFNCLTQNRNKFGVEQSLNIIHGRASDVMESMPKPNKVFIGGSGGELTDVLNTVWQKLPANGVLMASAVTEETKAELFAFAKTLSVDEAVFDCTQVSISRGEALAGQTIFRPNLPVMLTRWVKQSTSIVSDCEAHV